MSVAGPRCARPRPTLWSSVLSAVIPNAWQTLRLPTDTSNGQSEWLLSIDRSQNGQLSVYIMPCHMAHRSGETSPGSGS